MNIQLIKRMNEEMPILVKRIFAAAIRNQLIHHPVFQEQYQFLKEQEGKTEEEQQKFQFKQLKSLLCFAYENTVYYQELFDSVGFVPEAMKEIAEIVKIPILTKDILQQNYEKLQVNGITNYYQVSTGGTTGKPTTLLLEKDSIYKEWAFVYHYWSYFGYDYRKSRLVTFRGVNFKRGYSKYNPLYNELLLNIFTLNESNIKQYVKRIENFKGNFIYGYPSAIYHFCSLLYHSKIKINVEIKGCFLISENVYPFETEMIKRVLGCSIASFYGHSERSVFAELYGDGYVFNPYYGIYEVDKAQQITCTGFLNKKMPFIRYRLDDAAMIREDGKYLIQGHWQKEMLIGKTGEHISMAAVNFHDATFQNIQAFQFIQKEAGKVTLCIQADKNRGDIEKKKIIESVSRKLGTAFEVNIKLVEEITRTGRGKYQMLVQQINNQP